MERYIGKEMSRVDGVAKVTGRAKYAAEFRAPNLACGFIVLGAVAKGTIKTIDTREAERAPGVVRVFTHLNTPAMLRSSKPKSISSSCHNPLNSPRAFHITLLNFQKRKLPHHPNNLFVSLRRRLPHRRPLSLRYSI